MTKQCLLTKTMVVGLAMGMSVGCVKAHRQVSDVNPASAADVYAREGFFTQLDNDGRLWVFKADSDDLTAFKTQGNPARHVVRPSAGPLGVTLKSTESETIIEYVAAREGFFTQLDNDGRLWVFKADSDDLTAFKTQGKPARHVVRPGAGPLGLTLKAVDFETLDDYQAVE